MNGIYKNFASPKMVNKSLFAIASVLAVGSAFAANPANSQFTPIKEADCVLNTSGRFIAHDQAANSFPATPKGQFYLVARHMGTNSVATPVTGDFGSLGATPITNFHPPAPYGSWQRAKADGNANNVSGFQMRCTDAGSFINTWTFPYESVVGGGAHSFYSYDFAGPVATFDANPATDLVLQVSMEIPWFANWNANLGVAVGQASMVTYLLDTTTNKQLAYVINLFDNRFSNYTPGPQHDTSVPFLSSPLQSNSYLTVSPYSGVSTNQTWTGLRFFRAHISQANFINAVNSINSYCRDNRSLNNCDTDRSTNPASYKMVSFGVLHEVFRTVDTNVSMGIHLQGMGAYLAR